MGLRPGLLLAACWPFWLLGCCLRASSSSPDELLFKAWAAQNGKEYGCLEEYQQRLRIFLSNKRRVDQHNAGNHSFQMALNQFSDLTFAEFRKRFLWQEPQGPCGSCWTFSTTGCLESAVAIATGKLLELSEQQLVDCAQAFNNHGCSGGLPSQAFEYILYNGGLMEEDAYPYRGMNGTCKFQPGKAVAFVKDVVNITLYDEQSMVEAVGKHNPVSFAFQVTEDFMHYKEGVYSNSRCDKTPDKVNHAVLAVGYGEEEKGLPYWIVKNSWGAFWGMNGYFLIERGKNTCGLADCASFPVPRV
ncbi:pro-cathepsin H isoform X2 [Sceloporus undulatus]|uniref:pro-cathepsin H isoform X2 n=1 Tax=Sceloporus undulatus TaxID=8520 RepID=UPI001C4CC7B2|nr:pro-cathepsin H isoform X2 [Sceloporus undulatus]